MKFITGLIIGLLIGSLIGGGVVHAARLYTMSRSVIPDFEEDSVVLLNNILRDLWWAVDEIDDRIYDLENP